MLVVEEVGFAPITCCEAAGALLACTGETGKNVTRKNGL
jgi:hypothetical protein